MKAPFASNGKLPDVTITISGGARTFKSTLAELIVSTLMDKVNASPTLYDDDYSEVVPSEERLRALAKRNLRIIVETVETSSSSSNSTDDDKTAPKETTRNVEADDFVSRLVKVSNRLSQSTDSLQFVVDNVNCSDGVKDFLIKAITDNGNCSDTMTGTEMVSRQMDGLKKTLDEWKVEK